MTNLNKTYHKGRYRSYEWAQHLRPFLKRLGNKKFRKVAATFENDEFEKYQKVKRKSRKRKIKAKITIRSWGDSKLSYYKNFRTLKDLNNAVKRPNVIRYLILNDANG